MSAFLLQVLRGESISLPFSTSRGHLHPSAPSPFLISLLLLLSHLLILPVTFLSPSYKYPCDYIGPTWITPMLKSADQQSSSSCNLNALSPCQLIYSQVLGIRTWTSLGVGGIIHLTTSAYYVPSTLQIYILFDSVLLIRSTYHRQLEICVSLHFSI